MSPQLEKRLRLYETTVLANKQAFTGLASDTFQLSTGARIVYTLQVVSIDIGASATLKLKNSISLDLPFVEILSITGSAAGSFSKVVTDFHNIFEWELNVTGGNADVAIGISIFDNAAATRIENAVIETNVSAYPGIDGEYDSIRVSDGTDELNINPDGSINVNIVSSVENEIVKEFYGEALSVASGSETLVVNYTVPVGKKAKLQMIDFSGDNIAKYRYYKNDILTGMIRTHYGDGLSNKFSFIGGSEEGIPLVAGDTVKLKVLQDKPMIADFNGRIQVVEW